MKKLAKVFIGVDVSKEHLDVFIHPEDKSLRIKNSTSALKRLACDLSKYDVKQIVCEASGGYEQLLVKTLSKAGYPVFNMDPRRIHAFIASEGVRVKTDKNDAKMIALFAAEKKLGHVKQHNYCEESENLVSLAKRKFELTQMITMEKNRAQHPQRQLSKKSILSHIRFMEKTITKIEREINKIIDASTVLKKKAEIIGSVPGVGDVSAMALISFMPELGKIGNKQVSALLGVAPYTKQSGNYVGVSKIGGGRALPRHVLYMAALSASRCNPKLREFYQKLIANGKKPKVALIAVMRRLIVILNAMLRKEELWLAA